MYQSKAPMFLYCISPLHMGAGTALGIIDNPIQREMHTNHPMIAGSGLKGALRHHLVSGEWHGEKNRIDAIFGPPTDKDAHAGALTFSDAQIVAFPVRSLRQTYVYATCPTALERLKRLLVIAGIEEAKKWTVPEVQDNDRGMRALWLSNDELSMKHGGAEDSLVLEAFQFDAYSSGKEDLQVIAEWLQMNALPEGENENYFADKLGKHLVLMSDDCFSHFVNHSTVVEPHVRIDDTTGTASDGGLFYTEHLPPESLLVSLAMASRPRVKDGIDDLREASHVLDAVSSTLNGTLVQLGGNATTGRGQVILNFGKEA